jgi:hypothetical protein
MRLSIPDQLRRHEDWQECVGERCTS